MFSELISLFKTLKVKFNPKGLRTQSPLYLKFSFFWKNKKKKANISEGEEVNSLAYEMFGLGCREDASQEQQKCLHQGVTCCRLRLSPMTLHPGIHSLNHSVSLKMAKHTDLLESNKENKA